MPFAAVARTWRVWSPRVKFFTLIVENAMPSRLWSSRSLSMLYAYRYSSVSCAPTIPTLKIPGNVLMAKSCGCCWKPMAIGYTRNIWLVTGLVTPLASTYLT